MRTSGIRLTLLTAVTALVSVPGLAAAPTAGAAIPSVYGSLTCTAQPGSGNIRLCGGKTLTWDGATKIDVNVILPPEPATGPDGPYPAIGDFHGWGESKIGINDQTQRWAEDGYVVFSMSDRGWGNSCGSSDPEKLSLACTAGYNHLMDTRYEVRDAQYLLSILADEGVIEPQKIGATGMSYGGGLSMALAALRDRTMLPDGSLVAWKSPADTQMALAAAVPQWPWSDLAYSLMPNGRTLDYVVDSPYLGPDGNAPIGVLKSSYVAGLYDLGLAMSNYAPPGTDPDADLTTWYGLVNAGEPYDALPLADEIIEEITTHHSSYYIDHSQPPAPLLIQSGWNDDLFPVDEAIRTYNRTRAQFPGDPISLMLIDDGHARSQNKPADEEAFEARQDAWFDHYLKGEGPAPSSSAEALTTTCGGPSEGPFVAPSWRELAQGEVRLDSAPAQTIAPDAGDPSRGTTYDPIAGKDPCLTAPGADQAGVATYRLPAVAGNGFTLMGSPTIVADIDAPTPHSALAARLLDVAPDGNATLVARGLLRPGAGGIQFPFQLHPQAYKFAPGNVPKLELLPSDAPYSRPSNLQGPITISNLELRLPVREKPGAAGGEVKEPSPPIVPPGYQLVAGYPTAQPAGSGTPRSAGAIGLAKGKIRGRPKSVRLRLQCTGNADCAGALTLSFAGRKAGKRRTLASGSYSVSANSTSRLVLMLTKAGRRIVAKRAARPGHRPFRSRLEFADSGRGPFHLVRPIHVGRPRR